MPVTAPRSPVTKPFSMERITPSVDSTFATVPLAIVRTVCWLAVAAGAIGMAAARCR